ncbi:MAG: nuclear transport factor 2 family protein [Actinomycetota bacterium]|nr:nuclear transport factor 2 family protein [Actinomycetota bacterium]
MNPTGTTSASPAPAATRTAHEWVAGFAEGWRAPGGPESFAEHFRDMLAPDVRLIQPQLPTLVGYRAFEEEFVKPAFALIGDLRGEVERWAAHEQTLYIELTLRGTLARRPLSWRVCDRITLRDGLAVERESYFDPTPLLAAVAMTPRAWPRFLRLQAGKLRTSSNRRSSR